MATPSYVIKSGNTARTSTTTLADDPHLILTGLGAGKFYEFELVVNWGNAITATVPNIKRAIKFTGSLIFANGVICTNNRPHSSPSWRDTDNIGAHFNINAGVLTNGTAVTTSVTSSTGRGLFQARAYFKVGDTGGDLSFQWAQGTSSIQPTTVYADSWIYVCEREYPS